MLPPQAAAKALTVRAIDPPPPASQGPSARSTEAPRHPRRITGRPASAARSNTPTPTWEDPRRRDRDTRRNDATRAIRHTPQAGLVVRRVPDALPRRSSTARQQAAEAAAVRHLPDPPG